MSQKLEKYVHKGLALNHRGSFDQKAKDFVLATHGGDTPETYQKLREQAGGEPDWEVLAKSIAFMNKLASQPKRKKGRK
ncbi:hypothetical protein OAS27_01145 [Alphaproteobacteria bacterium]|nr:hypothetical protein [Alphaproteobacteria bacterium]